MYPNTGGSKTYDAWFHAFAASQWRICVKATATLAIFLGPALRRGLVEQIDNAGSNSRTEDMTGIAGQSTIATHWTKSTLGDKAIRLKDGLFALRARPRSNPYEYDKKRPSVITHHLYADFGLNADFGLKAVTPRTCILGIGLAISPRPRTPASASASCWFRRASRERQQTP
jgi:hypothetical protein